MMLEELEAGGRVYLVYPVIEQSEQLPQLRAASADLGTVSNQFQDYKCGLLHGRMKSDEKEEALRRFRSGETDILLSTQVIEIGVDVPEASMMVVMNAERFGMAQLHQLRGRVGRGERKSKCILVASTASSLNRLKVLEKSSDGFHLASVDLLLRGPGDLLGKKQSGHLPEFPIARLEMDGNILQEAHLAALVNVIISCPCYLKNVLFFSSCFFLISFKLGMSSDRYGLVSSYPLGPLQGICASSFLIEILVFSKQLIIPCPGIPAFKGNICTLILD